MIARFEFNNLFLFELKKPYKPQDIFRPVEVVQKQLPCF